MEHKLIPLEVKDIDDGGQFEGYASVFGVQDYDGDVIVRGAFSETLGRYREKGNMPKMLWQHDTREIVGRWTEMNEDDRGLWVKGNLIMDVQRGKEAYALMKAGVLDGMSIGFNIGESTAPEDRSRGRVIESLDLWEVSLVTWGANPDAKITAVKSWTCRDFEGLLRDAGFSRKEAKAISAEGFRAYESRRDAGAFNESDEGEELKESLANLQKTFTR